MSESNKPKRKVAERRPAGIKAMPAPPPRTLPDDHPARSLFKEAARDEAGHGTAATPTTTTGTTPTTTTTPTTPIAPTRDFMRVANSIVRDALPSGFFTGKRKQIYDYLYSVTRGAIVPTRTVRITMETLAIKADVGSDRTLRKHLRRLVDVGLLYVNEIGGTQGGNEFTVLIPEEITPTTSTTTPTTPHHSYHHPPDVPVVHVVESDSGTGGLSVGPEATSGRDKTSFKTSTERSDDDEASRQLFAAAKEITGKEVPAAQWREVIDVLVAELKIAAARTTVSSAPAFLAEHLRRRLWKIDKRQARAEGRELPDEVVSAAPREDTAGCPDCKGSGWWYPQGSEKGVAKCKHSRLVRPQAGN